MAPSLRKRLAKRAPGDANSTNSNNAFLPFLGAVEHLPKNRDLTSTPPPPHHLVTPDNSQKTRLSPSKALLERYRNRAPSLRAATSPILSDMSTKPAGNTTSSSKIAQSDERDLLSEDTNLDDVLKNTIRKISGVDFEMVNPTEAPAAAAAVAQREKSAETTTTPSLSTEIHPFLRSTRSTRSQTKREQRADSATSESNDLGSTAARTEDTITQVSKPQDDLPRPRSILKKRDPTSATPTPPEAKIPRTIRAVPAALSPQQTPPIKNRTPPTDSDSDSSAGMSDDSGSVRSLLTSTAKRTLEGTKRHVRTNIPPVEVVPPFPSDEVLPGLLWASPLSATSRPDRLREAFVWAPPLRPLLQAEEGR
ncbi:hypothetical protein Q7P37_007735 [Cladosporium fusiforme]